MSDNYEPCFYNISNNLQERWSLIREFTTKWHGIQFRDQKELLPLVQQEEAKLDFKLSPSFREYIIFYADANQIFDEHYGIKYFRKLSVVAFLWEYTGCQFWGISKENITATDPLIDIYQRDISYNENKKEDGFNCITDNQEKNTLTSCIFWLIFHSSRFSKGGDCSLVINNDSQLIDRMEENFDNKAVFDNALIYEKQNIVSIVKPIDRNNGNYIFHVFLWKSLSKNEIPEFIINYINDDLCREQGFSLSGVFTRLLDS